MDKILIGISAGLNDEPAHRVVMQYVDAIAATGALPVIVPVATDSEAIECILQRIDALLMIGGGDMHPKFWGEELTEQSGTPNEKRDEYDLLLVRKADELKIPVLGICRGMQTMAVAFGEKVIQDIPSHPDYAQVLNHKQTTARTHTSHTVQIERGSLLRAIVNSDEIEVNSFHHQAVAAAPKGWSVAAKSPDGIIEAIENRYKYMLGVQWHPEELFGERAEQKALFDWLYREAQLYAKARKVMRSHCIVDTHTDTPMVWTDTTDLRVRQPEDAIQTDFVKMRQTDLKAAFMVAYLPQHDLNDPQYHTFALEAKTKAATVFDRIDEQCRAAQDCISKQVYIDPESSRLQLLIGMENGFALAGDLKNIGQFARRGVRYITLCHNGDNDICDSAKGCATHGGLSEFGRAVVKEMNRVGVAVDVSHAADSTVEQVLKIAQPATVIATHTAARALCNHPRNLSDDLIRAIAAHGGRVHVCTYRYFLDEKGECDVHTIVKHLMYIASLIPASQVGIGSDFDGGGGVPGCSDESEIINIARELFRAGVADADVAAMMGADSYKWFNNIKINI